MQTIGKGAKVGQYIIQERLGAGTMGVVYAAEQPSMKRLVAIKFLPEEAAQLDAVKRFSREARMIARLEHPFVLPVYDFGYYDGNPYIVMRYMTGGTLLDRMVSGISIDSALHVLEQVARALDYAHRQGIIHRDLKPTNIFLDERGNAYLADFGLAKTLAGTEDLTTTAQGFAGTPLYISPEQAGSEKLDHQTDIYSLGVIAYEMLAGQPPYDDETPLGIVMKHITAPVPSIATERGLSPQVDAVFRWVLAKDPAGRPPTAIAFVEALQRALGDRDADANAETLRPVVLGPRQGNDVGTIRLTSPSVTAEAAPAVSDGAGPVTVAGETLWLGEERAFQRNWRWGAAVAAVVLLLAALFWARATLFAPGGAFSSTRIYTYPVGLSPRSLLYDGQAIWIANTLDHQIIRLAADNCEQAATACDWQMSTYGAPIAPLDVVFTGDSIWIAGGLSDALLELETDSGMVRGEHPLPQPPSQMLAAHDFVWVSHALDDEVSQLALDGRIVHRYPVGQSPRQLAADETAVWVANEGDNTVSRLEPATGQVGPTLALPERPLALAYADGFLWVALASDEVIKIDPAGGEIRARLATGREPVALLFAGNRLWVANEGSNTVVAIDVTRDRVGRPITVGNAPVALAWSPCGQGCGDLWVANEADSTVNRVRRP